jgi:hypothetical protein
LENERRGEGRAWREKGERISEDETDERQETRDKRRVMQTGEGGKRKKVDKNTGEAEWRRREKGGMRQEKADADWRKREK